MYFHRRYHTSIRHILSENKCCFGSWIFLRLTERGNDQVLFPSQRYVLLLFKGVKRLVLGFCIISGSLFVVQRNCFNCLQNCYCQDLDKDLYR